MPVKREFSGTPGTGDIGTLTVKVTATDTRGASVSSEYAIVVSAATGNPIATANAAFSYSYAPATFAEANAGDSLTHTATKKDGTQLPAWVTFDEEINVRAACFLRRRPRASVRGARADVRPPPLRSARRDDAPAARRVPTREPARECGGAQPA